MFSGTDSDERAKPLVVLLREMLDTVERSLADPERRILDVAQRDYELPWTLLQALPGTGPLAAAALLAEVGNDMEAFGTARRLASWAGMCPGMCPGSHESAGKSRGGKRRKGNVYLRRILCEVAHAAARTRGVQFGPYKVRAGGAARAGRSWRRRTRSCASRSRCCATANRTVTRRSTTERARRSGTRRAG